MLFIALWGFNVDKTYGLPLINQWGRYPFKLDTALVALIFFSLGNKSFQMIKRFFQRIRPIHFVIVIPLAVIVWMSPRFNGYVNICLCQYNNAIRFFSIALCGITLVLLISLILQKNSLFAFYGRNSLLIFSLHSFALILWRRLSADWQLENVLRATLGTVFAAIVMFVLTKILFKLSNKLSSKM